MESMQDFDAAFAEATAVVHRTLLGLWPGGNVEREDAEKIVGDLVYDRPDLVYRMCEHARRVWWWPESQKTSRSIWPLFFRGGDEFYNSTIAFRIPLMGTLIVALNVPLRRVPIPLSVEENPYGKR